MSVAVTVCLLLFVFYTFKTFHHVYHSVAFTNLEWFWNYFLDSGCWMRWISQPRFLWSTFWMVAAGPPTCCFKMPLNASSDTLRQSFSFCLLRLCPDAHAASFNHQFSLEKCAVFLINVNIFNVLCQQISSTSVPLWLVSCLILASPCYHLLSFILNSLRPSELLSASWIWSETHCSSYPGSRQNIYKWLQSAKLEGPF